MLLSPSSSSPSSICSDVIVNAATHLCTHNIADRLLQLGSIRSTGYYTCPLQRVLHADVLLLANLGYPAIKRASLATNRLPHQIQIMTHILQIHSSRRRVCFIVSGFHRWKPMVSKYPCADRVWKSFFPLPAHVLERASKQCTKDWQCHNI